MRISDWSSDVCSSDLPLAAQPAVDAVDGPRTRQRNADGVGLGVIAVDKAANRHFGRDPAALRAADAVRYRRNQPVSRQFARPTRQVNPGVILVGAAPALLASPRSEEHTSELQSLMRISYAVFCLKNKNIPTDTTANTSI